MPNKRSFSKYHRDSLDRFFGFHFKKSVKLCTPFTILSIIILTYLTKMRIIYRQRKIIDNAQYLFLLKSGSMLSFKKNEKPTMYKYNRLRKYLKNHDKVSDIIHNKSRLLNILAGDRQSKVTK